MGVSLSLVVDPYDRKDSRDSLLARTMLPFGSRIADRLTGITMPLLCGMTYWEDDVGAVLTHEDRCGEPLTFVFAGILIGVLKAAENRDPWENAVVAFIEALPVDTRVVLYWQ